MLTAASASSPSPLWFATRGAGVVTLVLLTVVVVLGITTSLRLQGRRTPRFVTATVHRNLSLFTILLLAVHITTSVLDPFAGLRGLDAVIPFGGAYRPFWLGLGVLAAELLAALAATSAARHLIGPRWWRLIHWLAYASWPLAVIHGLGTGSDARTPWLVGITSACTAAVLLALLARLQRGAWRTVPLRLAAGGVAVMVVTASIAWAVRGPLRPGWAAVAGTPVTSSPDSAAAATAALRARTRFSDPLVGAMTATPAGAAIAFRDSVDPELTVTILPPDATQTLPVVTVRRGSARLCAAPARVTATIYAVCGGSRIVVTLLGTPAQLSGRLTAAGPLR